MKKLHNLTTHGFISLIALFLSAMMPAEAFFKESFQYAEVPHDADTVCLRYHFTNDHPVAVSIIMGVAYSGRIRIRTLNAEGAPTGTFEPGQSGVVEVFAPVTKPLNRDSFYMRATSGNEVFDHKLSFFLLRKPVVELVSDKIHVDGKIPSAVYKIKCPGGSLKKYTLKFDKDTLDVSSDEAGVSVKCLRADKLPQFIEWVDETKQGKKVVGMIEVCLLDESSITHLIQRQ